MELGQQDPSGCDRRRSRAARNLIMNNMLPILQKYHSIDHTDRHASPNSNSKPKSTSRNARTLDQSNRDRMETYEQILTDLITNNDSDSNKNVDSNNTCILHPKRDVFWNEELQYTSSKYKRQLTSTLHKCEFCGKTFLSRFYLDLHMEHSPTCGHAHHHHDPNLSNANDSVNIDVNANIHKICPANEICHLLGGKLCDREALEQEPFYAPGIHNHRRNQGNHLGHAHYSQTVLRNFQRKVYDQPCDEVALEVSRRYCINSIHACFDVNDNDNDGKMDADGNQRRDLDVDRKGLIRDLIGTLCETQTCQYHLHAHTVAVQQDQDPSFGAPKGASSSGIHTLHTSTNHLLKHQWKKYHDEMHEIGFGLVFVCVIGIIVCFRRYAADMILLVQRKRKKHHRFNLEKRKKL